MWSIFLTTEKLVYPKHTLRMELDVSIFEEFNLFDVNNMWPASIPPSVYQVYTHFTVTLQKS